MAKYILNRIIYLLPVLFIMSVVVFSFIHLIPGDPVDAILGLNASDEARTEVRKSLGLDRNVVVQYLAWIGGGPDRGFRRLGGQPRTRSETDPGKAAGHAAAGRCIHPGLGFHCHYRRHHCGGQ